MAGTGILNLWGRRLTNLTERIEVIYRNLRYSRVDVMSKMHRTSHTQEKDARAEVKATVKKG
jgi:hypothetical protein